MPPGPVLPPLPPEVAERVRASAGDAGATWLAQLHATVTAYLDTHGLRVRRRLPASYSYVLETVDSSNRRLVLKCAPPTAGFASEVAALAAFAGHGGVLLADADMARGVVLMERALPGRPASDLPDEDATGIAADVLRRLHMASPGDRVPFTPVRRFLATLAGHSRRAPRSPVPPLLLQRAAGVFRDLIASSGPPVLLHGDLHHWNVVESASEWLAIDPKGYLGEPAYDAGTWLRNPVDRLASWRDLRRVQDRRIAQFSERLDLDQDRIRAWGFSQAVLSACWTVEEATGSPEAAIAAAESLLPGS